MGQKILNKFILYLMEITLGYLLFLPFYQYHWNLLVPLIMLTLLILIIAIPFLKLVQKGPLFIYYLILLIVTLISHVIWFHLFFALVMTMYLGWRMLEMITDQTLLSSWSLFLTTAITSVIYYIGVQISHTAFPNSILILLFIPIQLFMTLVANSVSQPGKSSHKAYIIVVTFVALSGLSLVLGFILQVVSPLLKISLATIFGGIGYGFIYIFMPLINLFQHTYKAKEERVGKFIDSLHSQNNQYPSLIPNHHPHPVITTILLILLFIGLSTIIYIFLKHKKLPYVANQHINSLSKEVALKKTDFLSQTKNEKPPRHDRVRFLFYQFQRKMKKLGYGRYRMETMEEWFQRLPIYSNNHVVLLYEKSRYGQQPLTQQEFIDYKDQLKRLTEECIQKTKHPSPSNEE